MAIELNPEQQRLIEQAIQSGVYHDTDEVISAALGTLANDLQDSTQPRKSRLWELREGLALGEISLREIIEDGRE